MLNQKKLKAAQSEITELKKQLNDRENTMMRVLIKLDPYNPGVRHKIHGMAALVHRIYPEGSGIRVVLVAANEYFTGVIRLG